jgi:hypothetical protein
MDKLRNIPFSPPDITDEEIVEVIDALTQSNIRSQSSVSGLYPLTAVGRPGTTISQTGSSSSSGGSSGSSSGYIPPSGSSGSSSGYIPPSGGSGY